MVESLESRRLLAAVNIPTNLSGSAGTVVAAPVQIDTASGVRAAQIRISYDTDILNITPEAIQAGSVWAGNSDIQVTANVDDAAGTIVLFIASANAASAASGSLAILNFTLASGAVNADTATLNVTSVTLNEGAISVTPAPVPGADSTDGLITVSASSTSGTISGFVFADANRNGVLDAGEAIAGVTIRLTNSTSGVSQQTTTGSDGSYRFAGLVAAGYRIEETQPAAFFEGGSNTLNVQLTSGNGLTNQNFVEGGLQPAAIFTRLRTTLVMPVGSAAWQNTIASAVQVVTAASSAQGGGFISTLSTPTISTLANNNTTDTSPNVRSLRAEGEYVAPPATNSAPAPLTDVETREKQRRAAIERAMLDF